LREPWGESVMRAFLELYALAAVVLSQLAGLLIIVLTAPYMKRKSRRILLIVIGMVFSLIVQNLTDDLLSVGEPRTFIRTLTAVYGYAVRPAILVMFFYIVNPEKKYRTAWLLTGINAAIYMTAFFSRLTFSFSDLNEYHGGGPLNFTCWLVSGVFLAYLLYITIRQSRLAGTGDPWIPLFTALLIVGAVILDGQVGHMRQPISFLTAAVVESFVFYYIWLHRQFVREHEQALLAEQRMQIMLAQIQPHFINNSLSTISEVYRTDLKKGEQAMTEFAFYLRHNMDALTKERLIPFEKELEHVRCYLSLQKLRFGDMLNVEYDLETTELSLPTLTLQPLVENAVTYGVRLTPTGRGTVVIRSREYGDRYEVQVEDDGPGFVPDNDLGDREHAHIGLKNVRERLSQVCGGELIIHSEQGKGTTATMVLRKEGAPHADLRD